MAEYKNLFKENDFKIFPIEQAETIPSQWYADESFHKVDLNAIFYKTWQYIGSDKELQKSGDFIIAEIGEKPVIILNDDKNNLRAFYNVCRHRAGPLATEEGNAKTLKCKYHGWSYNLDGKLIGTPEFEGVECFEKNNYSLKELNVTNWNGMLFINVSENPEPFADIIDGIDSRISPINLRNKKFYSRITYELNCNWKVYIDNYLEGYHLPHVHPELNELLDYKNYVTETYENYSLQYSPLNPEDNLYSSGDEAFYYFIAPNFMLNILPGRLQTNAIIPLAFNKTKVIFDYYYDDIESKEALEFIEKDLAYSDVVQLQDIKVCALVFKGLLSGAYEKGRLSVKREKGLYHFHNQIRKYYSDYSSEL